MENRLPFLNRINISSCSLHILAMLCMLLDHMWATVLPNAVWMTCVGRIVYPIFAFMLVEGYYHTKNIKRYFIRLFAFALVSEIPFDLMYGNMPWYPYHQNVLWTFLIALLGMCLLERCRRKMLETKSAQKVVYMLAIGLVILVSFLLGFVLMVDYYGVGILTVYVFYFFRERKWWQLLGQFVCLYYLNVELLGGLYYPISIGGVELELVQQGIALLALLPIWLYHGRQGYHAKWFQYLCYAFYPVHILVLAVLF